MAWKLFSILVACLMALFVTTSIAHAQEKITGPWLWMIAPTVPGQGGARSINVDSLAVASNGAVTETDVATNGANEGDRIGNFVWTFGRISDTGGDNINQCLNRIGLAAGNMDDHSSYALFTFKSDTTRSNVTMRVGSDDAVKVWLNGKVVHNNPTDRGASDFQDRFQVDLRRGENLLMVKVSERTGGWSMFVGIDTFGGGDDGRVREPDFETPAQSPQQRPIVRLIYFLPKDREPQPDIDAKMDRVLKEIQQHYADEMERLGYGKKTFKLETGANGRVVVHRMKGNFNDADYRFDTFNTIANEINKQYDTFKNVYFVAANTATGFESYVSGRERVCGLGGHFTLVRSLDECFTTNYGFLIAAHELGHTFGLQHDFRNDTYLMSYSGGTDLSPCDAEWLDVHRAFNSSQATSDERATIEMLPPSLASPPNAIRFRFEVIDPDGLHQARLHTTTLSGAAAGFLELVSCKQLNGNPNSTAELVTTYLGPKNKSVSLQVIDVHGNFTQSREFSVNITSILPRPKVVSIPDANLAAAVRREIGNSITTHTMLNLRRLDARNHGITDLTGLEHAHNLRQVNLGDEYIQGEGSVNNNAVSDFSPLFGLAQLTDLNLSSSSLSDVSFLENLTQLTFVDLYSNTISDVSPLANLTQLTHLNLYSNTISDVSPLANLTQLTHLNLYNNAISDISPLANLTQLTSVDLYSNTISDVSPLANLTQLTYLRLGGNTISDVSPLANLTQLTYLELGNNAISDVSPLANLTQLTYLNLYNNAISDVSPLAGLNLTGTQWDSTGLDLKLNPLNYASINTHIPAMQARGIEVKLDSRAPTTLVKISGTAQQGVVNTTLPLLFVVEVRDQQNRAFAGVPVTFSVTANGGRLSATTATTDLNGRAQAHLTLGQTPGTNTVRVTATEISQPVQFTATGTRLSTPVAILDTNLHTQIAAALGKTPRHSITVADMLALTELTANNANIRDLTGLQQASNLTKLLLDDNNISDVAPLEALTRLKTLSLDDNNIADVAPLTGLPELTTLSLENNSLSDVAPLADLPKLKMLYVRGNLLSYPSLHTHIRVIQTGGTTVTVDTRIPTTLIKVSSTHGVVGAALSLIVEVQDENGVRFAGVPVTFSVTAGGGSLFTANVITDRTGRARTTLTLGATPGKNAVRAAATDAPRPANFTVTAIDANSRVTIRDANLRAKIAEILSKPQGVQLTAGDMLGLTRLEVPNANIQDLTGLEHAHNLRQVNLGDEYIQGEGSVNNNAVSDFSPLFGLAQLTDLNLSSSSLSDVSFLENLTQLTFVQLSSDTISDVSPLANLTQLTRLNLYNNAISDISPLANLTQLTSVDLYSNTISDVSPLANLTQLTYLRLGGNTISDVSPLANLTQLTYLELGNNAISDVSPLANLTQLTYLNLYNNAISDVSPLAGLNLTGTQWDSTGLDLKLNPLNYASINTHIPAMQARGIEVEFDPRTYPALDIISGTGQQAAGGDTLENPFVAAAIDARGTPMRGVAVTFAVIRGMGELTATTATTDASGRAETTLTLGPNPGRYFVYATAAALESSVRFIAIAVEAPKRITENVEAPEYIAEDVNGDGVVDVQDLVLVVDSLGETGQNKADVNGDGNVDIADVLLVAGAFEVDAAAPALHPSALEGFTEAEVQRLLTRARQLALTDPAYLRGIAVLEQLLALLLPRETTLLANYPNPFNPETWIPYQLAKPTEVTLHIYSVKGELVRTLALGHQPVGMYHSKSRAAYWDGRNEQGEKVASGVYFYTLSAGGFTPTRKMLVRK